MFISYKVQGRFGNNVFQYIATKLLITILNDIGIKCEYKYNQTENARMLSEFQYLQILQTIIINPPVAHTIFSSNIFLDGFFQFQEHILTFLNIIKQFFYDGNSDKINDTYSVKDFVSEIKKCKKSFNENDIVTHVRLDDFKQSSVIINHSSIIKLIKDIQLNIRGGKVYVVVDKLKEQYEKDYISSLVKELNSEIISNENMFDDLASLWFAPNLVCNNSSFCWIAGILGEAKKTWTPKQKNVHICQTIEKVRTDSTVYDWEPLN